MKIIVTLTIPDERLTMLLKEQGLTLEKFKGSLVRELLDGLDAEELCPGATAAIEVKD